MAHYLEIGIDFGTTYSGVAFASSRDPELIDVISKWDMFEGNEKVPTKISFQDGDSNIHWGKKIPPDHKAFSWFKLLLVDEIELSPEVRKSPYLQRAQAQMKAEKRNAVELVAAYLRQLWNHTLRYLADTYSEEELRYMPFKVFLTVPAIWKDKALARMEQAVERAGIRDERKFADATTVKLISEPEAAAFAVFKEFKGQHVIKQGDVFVVCDAGGGTVDVISYEILSTDPMDIREAVGGAGAMCGGVFVDENFLNQVQQRLTKAKWDEVTVANQQRFMDHQWHRDIKIEFDGSNQDWPIEIPVGIRELKESRTGLKWSRSRKPGPSKDQSEKKAEAPGPLVIGQMVFNTDHIRLCFSSSLLGTSRLLRDQIDATSEQNKSVKAILLVGGFGDCKYLFSQLRAEFDTEAKGIKVLSPMRSRAWSAITRGAVVLGLNELGAAVSNKLQYRTEFEASEHSSVDKVWYHDMGRYYARNQMKWYLHKGDHVDSRQPVSFEFFDLLREPTESIPVSIYSNTESIPPSRITPMVKKVKTLTISINVDFDELPEQISADTGETLRRLDLSIQMTTTLASMEWTVVINGVPQGRETLTIEDME